MDDNTITRLCRQHGAKTLSDAAYAAMEGRRAAIEALGVDAKGLATLHRITCLAYRLMSAEDQASDLAYAAIKGAKL